MAMNETHWEHYKANNVSSTLKSMNSYGVIEQVDLVAYVLCELYRIHVDLIYS